MKERGGRLTPRVPSMSFKVGHHAQEFLVRDVSVVGKAVQQLTELIEERCILGCPEVVQPGELGLDDSAIPDG